MTEGYVYNCLYTNHSDNLMAYAKVVEKQEKDKHETNTIKKNQYFS